MKESVTGTGMFFRTLRSCITETWKGVDSQYHIPKSRFSGDLNLESRDWTSRSEGGGHQKKHYFSRFRNCLIFAWKAADSHYHIPKSRHGNAA